MGNTMPPRDPDEDEEDEDEEEEDERTRTGRRTAGRARAGRRLELMRGEKLDVVILADPDGNQIVFAHGKAESHRAVK